MKLYNIMKPKQITKINATCPACEKLFKHSVTHYDKLRNDLEVMFICPYCKENFSGKLRIPIIKP